MEEKAKTTPRGVMIYQTAGTPFSMSSSLAVQLVLDLLVALIMAWLMTMVRPGLQGMGAKICFAVTIGAIGMVAIILPWWNWYGMPLGMVGVNLMEQLAGFAVLGAVLGKLLK